MKLFLDSANLQDIEACLKRGFLDGITTNPSILAKEPKTDFVKHIRKIANLCNQYKQPIPLSVEVFTRHADKMVEQAMQIAEEIGYENLNIKIPIGWDELEVIAELARRGVKVNCTCIFTEAQCTLAADAGATYVSIFFGRLRDIGCDPIPVIANTRQLLERAKKGSEIIVGSIRHERDIADSHIAGAHIVTAGAQLFAKMAMHPQTTKSVDGFLKDFEAWLK
ncbi:MAG TPA: transaldolase family protein [Lacunisphaera sp.]|jgi:transaldolase|nr:transaldolase family protein [Lacunisphaera sp.]